VAIANLPSGALAQERPPNIVIILADDLDWTDVGCQTSAKSKTWP
jgi:arylsulfatase A-like enzyme